MWQENKKMIKERKRERAPFVGSPANELWIYYEAKWAIPQNTGQRVQTIKLFRFSPNFENLY